MGGIFYIFKNNSAKQIEMGEWINICNQTARTINLNILRNLPNISMKKLVQIYRTTKLKKIATNYALPNISMAQYTLHQKQPQPINLEALPLNPSNLVQMQTLIHKTNLKANQATNLHLPAHLKVQVRPIRSNCQRLKKKEKDPKRREHYPKKEKT